MWRDTSSNLFLSAFIILLTSNILSFHRLGRPGGMNPVCFFRSTMRRSIFSSRSMMRTTDTSIVGSRRTVTMDLCRTIHNCLANSSDNPWTWTTKYRSLKPHICCSSSFKCILLFWDEKNLWPPFLFFSFLGEDVWHHTRTGPTLRFSSHQQDVLF